MRKLLKIAAVLFAVLVIAVTALVVSLRNPLPKGSAGPEAEALTDKVLAAVNAPAWGAVGAVEWSFGGRPLIVWDRVGRRARVGEGQDLTWIDLDTRRGRAIRGGVALEGAALDAALERAWADFINDRFWLNPFPQLRAEGTERQVVEVDGRPALRVDFRSGGVTPGDAYIFLLDDSGRPTAWRLYVGVIPIEGLEVGWGGWEQLPGGAWVSTKHAALGLEPGIERLKAGPDLASIGAADAFDASTPPAPASQPASQPASN